MKKIILSLVIFISINCFAQKGKIDSSKLNAMASIILPQQQQNPDPKQSFYLLGARNDFVILLMALTKPGDVTPNQIKQLADWINQYARPLPIDTTVNKN